MISFWEDFLLAAVDDPFLQSVLLFLGTFVLEEAALMAGGALSAAQELPPFAALGALYAGMVVSDWMLYAAGFLAGSSPRVRRFVREENIRHGRALLARSHLLAALSARLVPWLLLPIFVASGFVRIGFFRFAAVNALIALIYTNVLFWTIYAFGTVLFDQLRAWGWLIVALATVAVSALSWHRARRAGVKAPGRPAPNPPSEQP